MRELSEAKASLPSKVSEGLAAAAVRALLAELESWPKPGLVSQRDCGSHLDMNAATFRTSAAAIAPFFGYLAAAGALRSSLPALRQIGIDAERAMLDATGGINTHRGAIFGLGLLCAAAGATWWQAARTTGCWNAADLTATVRLRWGPGIVNGPAAHASHGTQAWRDFGVRGARGEAASGFPLVTGVGLPALRRGRDIAPTDREAARIQAFFALLNVAEDTNLLHRGGSAGLHFARSAAAEFLARGGVAAPDWRNRAVTLHREFIVRRLSPGGCADLLALTLFVDSLQTGSWHVPLTRT